MSLRHVVCAISGGVDSAVSAYMLLKQGHKVTGVYMSNWDQRDETSESFCSNEQDQADAEKVCDKLGIPLRHVDFSAQYWNQVFQPFLDGYKAGITPNPDVMCNRHIKFDKLVRTVHGDMGADLLATGHYADTADNRLYVPLDVYKDQTYFLGQIRRESLSRVVFPLANIMKPDVKKIAAQIGLDFLVRKRESMGICFVGKKSHFRRFLGSYLEPMEGNLVDVDSGKVIGKCDHINMLTIGQRIPHYDHYQCGVVLHTDLESRLCYVCHGSNHQLLFSDRFTTNAPLWINQPSGMHPPEGVNCYVRCQRLMPPIPCHVKRMRDNRLEVVTQRPIRALRSGQLAVFYAPDKRECWGGAAILDPSPGLRLPQVTLSDWALAYGSANRR